MTLAFSRLLLNDEKFNPMGGDNSSILGSGRIPRGLDRFAIKFLTPASMPDDIRDGFQVLELSFGLTNDVEFRRCFCEGT